MGYFPFFADITGVTVRVIGSGKKAAEKIERLMPFQPNLIAMPEFQGWLEEPRPAFVVAASDSPEENRKVLDYCRGRGIPVNVVDDKENSDFLFPAMLTGERLTVAVSTAGASPAAAVLLKEKIAALLPEHLEDILQWLEEIRPSVKGRIPSAQLRKAVFNRIVCRSMELDRPLSAEELEAIYEKTVS